MNINDLIAIIKKKLNSNLVIQHIEIEDKSYLHKNHPGNRSDKFHIKIRIKSEYLKKKSRIESTKKIYEILDLELKNYIHSIQILIT
tara:strand:+ start:134 stop:394 length:261 start_codon:yes stop_codon:yes gene_type:complete